MQKTNFKEGMSKEIIFDLDGTIADLYGVNNWMQELDAGNVTPYQMADLMYDEVMLNSCLDLLKELNYTIKIVSWGSKTVVGNKEALYEIEKAKKEWLKKYGIPYQELHVIDYGTPKSNFINSTFSILIDDSLEVQDEFLHSNKGCVKMVIDAANENILDCLIELIEMELEEK